MEVTASPEEIAVVEAEFARAGFRVRAEAQIPPFGGGPPATWDWIVHVMLAAPIAVFLTTFAAKASEDAYEAFKRWTRDFLAARQPSGERGELAISSDRDEITLVIRANIPDEALDALAEIDWSPEHGGYLVWNDSRRQWQGERKPKSGETTPTD